MISRVFKELLRRRVPQFLGAYLAAGWAALEFTDFLVNRYLLSPQLTDFVLVVWALLLPTLLMLTWFHGAPGADRWTRVEKIGIPVNLGVAAVVLLISFTGEDLGATTRSVTIEDEAGQQVERTVPKGEFRESVVTYFFDNATDDTALDWLQYGIPWALEYDLEQDMFIDTRPTQIVIDRLRERGIPDGLRVSLALKKDIAEELNLSYFVSGELGRADGQLAVTTRLYESERGNLVQERTFTGDDIFALVDRMALQLKQDLDLPSGHLEEVTDLPVSEILTSSLPAFRSFADALRAMLIDNDFETGAVQLAAAVSDDPQFALAHLTLFEAYLSLNRMQEAEDAIDTAMGLLYKLPEPSQLSAKAAYYWIVRQNISKALTAAGMHAELYPQDIQAHETLARFYTALADRRRAIESLLRVLELDPGRIDVLRQVADLYAASGAFDTAFAYLTRYAEKAPTDPQSLISLGRLRMLIGEHEVAREAFEKATVVDPGNVAAQIQLGHLERNLGNFDAALEIYEEALANAVTAQQRQQVYAAMQAYYRSRAQFGPAIEAMHDSWDEMEQHQPPFVVLQGKLQDIDTYVEAGQVRTARDSLAAIADQLSPPFDVLLPMGRLEMYLELEVADSIEAALPGLNRLIEAFGLEELRALHVYAQGRVLELRGDCEQAIISYDRVLELDARNIGIWEDLGRCHRKLGDYDAARRELERLLAVYPYHPRGHLELARVEAKRGERESARRHLRVALDTWANADPGFEPAREARRELEALSSGSRVGAESERND
ncbi:MAG: tetratricopeptide repeat protein [Gemmatimonadetes bacterium]|uniref:Tetratricopeptide repeat protein n=1 Tax=Candidatus Kutchimonas denitrificans TaxID=3056748 RepID=A0AAE4ZB95_9BACT|nr:tetratricopeptide repeat protein [Gemmatimonadota bacterium]NIR74275.1 tetratricopeptide repeat protein [Candidatus Kutchimonas denitrificans]NIS02530.1 tetratricopeptide repeat protein [Gemmatimonadota bacterium]NIT68406.1 tetratricopeptide repeat protein [Gemmatimonadota bacterium]NIU51858.1 tetratricopeptide repeat protein [Gemmatimonadota bacterium]